MAKYKIISSKIQEVKIDNKKTDGGEIRWVNIADSGKKELEYLRKKYKFSIHHLQLSSAKSVAQRPIIEKGDNYIFMIMHFPIHRDGVIFTEEIDFFIGKDFLVTLHNNRMKSLIDFFNLCKKDGDSLLSYQFESVAVLVYELLEKLMLTRYILLDKVSLAIEKVEDLIFHHEEKKAVSEILHIRRNVVNIRKIMQYHKNILKKLIEIDPAISKSRTIKNYYYQLIDHAKRIWENLEHQKEMIEALHDTNESFLNYKIGDIMKTLTIISVIVFPLTLFAAVFGMNTVSSMPFVDNPYGFWIILAIMTTVSLLMLLYFERKKWL